MKNKRFLVQMILFSLIIGSLGFVGGVHWRTQHGASVGSPSSVSITQGVTSTDSSGNGKHASVSGFDGKIMAWVYPGESACRAYEEYSDGRRIDILKPEYFRIEDGGLIRLLTADRDGCNGFSSDNLARIKKYSKQQYITVSSSYAKNMDVFLQHALSNDDDINTLVQFVADNGVTGIEIDFEDFGGWTVDSYSRYKQFIERLGTNLHSEGKGLIVDGPAIASDEESSWFRWRYADFSSLPVDFVIVMAYDHQFDYGSGSPIAPLEWIKSVVSRTLREFPDKDRLSVGIPSYGYEGIADSNKVTILTFEQIRSKPGFSTATRDSLSAEMTWKYDGHVYFYQDSESIEKKQAVIKELGISSISIWHLGGENPWISD